MQNIIRIHKIKEGRSLTDIQEMKRGSKRRQKEKTSKN